MMISRKFVRRLCALVPALFVLCRFGEAVADELRVTDADRGFWSFRPLTRPELPAVEDPAWTANPIDRFVLATLAAQGLAPAPEADKRTLVRRLYFDLIGLPPAPDEVDAFLADHAPDAYERLVDRLLASPRFGERWARHWLDVARYADSDGYEFDIERPTAYHYRDFVISALNDDMPYDQFLRWQIAGDEYAPDNPLALAATGFLTCGPTISNQESEKNRYDELDDMLSTTGSAVLGLTLGCARCHDHKYDPIASRDYYRMLSAFTTTRRREALLTSRREAAEYQQRLGAWQGVLKARQDEFERFKETLRTPLREAKLQAISVSPEDQVLLRQTPDSSNVRQQELLAKFGEQLKVTDEEMRAGRPLETLQRWDALAKGVAEEEARKPVSPPTALAITDAQSEPAANFLLARGDPNLKQEPTSLGFLSVLPGSDGADFQPASLRRPEVPGTFQRSALAEWLTDPRRGAGHLAARVMMNRLWDHHFGQGIVRTPGDFGSQGDRPSHPELLDWLASELIVQGWHLKPLHKLIVMSAAYRQAGDWDAAKAGVDPQNRLLWRRAPRRLEAESIRDAMLSATGCLNVDMFGPGVFPQVHPDAIATGSSAKWPVDAKDDPRSWRRSVYIFVRRSARVPMMETFDAPDSTLSCSRRIPTVVPSQALALLNSQFSAEQAEYLARRALRESGDDLAAAISMVYCLALCRSPGAGELETGLAFLSGQTARHASVPSGKDPAFIAFIDFCQAVLNLNEFIYVD